MTREEAIKYAESKKMRLEALVYSDDCKYGNYAMYSGELSFVNAALSALRPVNREQVEKVWRGEWIDTRKSGKDVPTCMCSRCTRVVVGLESKFCPDCGSPMTDEAVEITMRRLEALNENRD